MTPNDDDRRAAAEAKEFVAMIHEKADASRPDDFDGEDDHLVQCIWAFLDLTDQQAFVPFNIPKGSHAYRLLNAAAHRLEAAERRGMERAAGICEAEHLADPQDETDAAYDHAIDDCIAAIRAEITNEGG